jgi:hypothetical protein
VAPVEARRAISWLEEEAAIHGIVVEGVIRRGNPVRQLLEVGKAADLVILSENPLRVAPEDLLSIEVLRTIKGGEGLWSRPATW